LIRPTDIVYYASDIYRLSTIAATLKHCTS
jgi:hypothetical protein